MVRQAIRAQKAGKKWEALVGYTVSDLMAHLERNFKDGMGWHNYGQWQIDHIKPRAAFKYGSYDDPAFRECWALNNLQPLWAEENLKKGAQCAA